MNSSQLDLVSLEELSSVEGGVVLAAGAVVILSMYAFAAGLVVGEAIFG